MLFEWWWVLVRVGAGAARGALYLPMVRPSSYVASSSSLLTNGQTIAGIIIILRGIIITTNIIIAIIIITHTIIRTELNCMEQDDKQLLAGLREEFLQAPSYEVPLFYSCSDFRILIFLIA